MRRAPWWKRQDGSSCTSQSTSAIPLRGGDLSSAFFDEDRAGGNKDVESLFFHHSSDRDDLRRPIRRGKERQSFQIKSIVNPPHPACGRAERFPEKSNIVITHGHDRDRLVQLAPHHLGLHILVKNVFGMCGETVGHAREPGCQHGNGG